MSDEVKKTGNQPQKEPHKLGADRHDPAKNPEKEQGNHKTSKDIREDRGIRKHKLGKHRN
jgi:hypothetical protein